MRTHRSPNNRSGPSQGKYRHPNVPVPAEFLKPIKTRPAVRDALRDVEYSAIGVGLHKAATKAYDLPRKKLRAIARAIFTRRWKARPKPPEPALEKENQS